jgi:hypothetical protein
VNSQPPEWPAWLAWIRLAIDGLGVHDRDGWAFVVAGRRLWIDMFVEGQALPWPGALRAVVQTLRLLPSCRPALESWNELAARPLHDVWPRTGAVEEAPTLAHYIAKPLWGSLLQAIAWRPAQAQEELLAGFIATATNQPTPDDPGRRLFERWRERAMLQIRTADVRADARAGGGAAALANRKWDQLAEWERVGWAGIATNDMGTT